MGLSIDQTGFECLGDKAEGIGNLSVQLTFIKPQIYQHRKGFMTSNKQHCHVKDNNILLNLEFQFKCITIVIL